MNKKKHNFPDSDFVFDIQFLIYDHFLLGFPFTLFYISWARTVAYKVG